MTYEGSYMWRLRQKVGKEVGLRVAADDFVAFASLSGDAHTLSYSNGDVSQAYSLCFLAERWEGDPRPDGTEATELRWVDPADPPVPTHEASAQVLRLLAAYEETGRFQAA